LVPLAGRRVLVKKGTEAAILRVSRRLESQGLDAFQILVLASWAEDEIQKLQTGSSRSGVPLYLFSPDRQGHLTRLKYLRTHSASGPIAPLAPAEAASILRENSWLLESFHIRAFIRVAKGLPEIAEKEAKRWSSSLGRFSRTTFDRQAIELIEELMRHGIKEKDATEAVAKRFGRPAGALRINRSRSRIKAGKGRPPKKRGPRLA
jgi:hypothetical protein